MNSDQKLTEYSLISDEVYVYGEEVSKQTWNLSPKSLYSNVKTNLYEAFLPRGYPQSVSDDYTEYQIWDSLQACCSTLSGMLAVQSVLLGVGVGQANATPLAAATAWFFKDGVGMISGITFAWLKGTSLDADCKKWRLFADFVNDFALCVELSIPFWPIHPVVLLCVSSSLKALVGVAGGATRAVFTNHMAVNGNTADVAAKDASQETLVNLVATVFGIGLIHRELTQRWAWVVMLVLVCLHIFCNYRAVKSLKFRTFNEERLWIILDRFLLDRKILSVEEVNKKESVFLGFRPVFRPYSLKFGESLRRFKVDVDVEKPPSGFLLFLEGNYVSVALHDTNTDFHIIHAFFLVAQAFKNGSLQKLLGYNGQSAISSEFSTFLAKTAAAGWDTSRLLVPVGPWRYKINNFKSKTT